MALSFQLRAYIIYWLDAVDEHSLHSPFFYDFYTQVVRGADTASYDIMEQLRQQLLTSEHTVEVAELGAGSAKLKGNQRRLRDIAHTSLTPARYAALYRRLIACYQCKNILELGTSLGINTLYLAHTPGTHVTTFEGIPDIVTTATSTFEFAQATNIRIVAGNLDNTLPQYLDNAHRFDLALMDANHRYAPTMRYFELLLKHVHHKSIIIADDIHLSAEMEQAWRAMQQHELVYASADLYRCGILFFDPSLNKQHVVLQF